MIIVLILNEAYSKPTRFKKASVNRKDENSVWIVPGDVEWTGDIDNLLAGMGIRVLERVTDQEAEQCAKDIRTKFENRGFEVKREWLCND